MTQADQLQNYNEAIGAAKVLINQISIGKSYFWQINKPKLMFHKRENGSVLEFLLFPDKSIHHRGKAYACFEDLDENH